MRLQRDSNPWLPWYRCNALPTELWSLNGSRSGESSIYTRYMKRMMWSVCDKDSLLAVHSYALDHIYIYIYTLHITYNCENLQLYKRPWKPDLTDACSINGGESQINMCLLMQWESFVDAVGVFCWCTVYVVRLHVIIVCWCSVVICWCSETCLLMQWESFVDAVRLVCWCSGSHLLM